MPLTDQGNDYDDSATLVLSRQEIPVLANLRKRVGRGGADSEWFGVLTVDSIYRQAIIPLPGGAPVTFRTNAGEGLAYVTKLRDGSPVVLEVANIGKPPW